MQRYGGGCCDLDFGVWARKREAGTREREKTRQLKKQKREIKERRKRDNEQHDKTKKRVVPRKGGDGGEGEFLNRL